MAPRNEKKVEMEVGKEGLLAAFSICLFRHSSDNLSFNYQKLWLAGHQEIM